MELLAVLAAVAVTQVAVSWLVAGWRGRRAARRPMEPVTRDGAWPTVSVIVPAWEERAVIRRCLTQLAAVDYPAWEVVVVAGGTDGTHEAAVATSRDMPRVRVIRQAPLGKPTALNDGLRAAAGQIVVLLDADSIVGGDWLRALVAAVGPAYPASTGRAVPIRATPVSRAEEMERTAAYEVARRCALQGSAGIAIERSVLDRLGGFPRDAYADDWELDARLAAEGLARAYCRDAVVRTERPSTLPEYWRNELRWRRAHLASLIHLRDYFFATPRRALGSIRPYAMAWLVAASLALALVLAAANDSVAGAPAIGVWVIALGWLLIAQSSRAPEIAAFTGDRSWLRLAWVPPVLYAVTLLAGLEATLTIRAATFSFKGPRPHVRDDA